MWRVTYHVGDDVELSRPLSRFPKGTRATVVAVSQVPPTARIRIAGQEWTVSPIMIAPPFLTQLEEAFA